jgi:hypothetical protein
VSALAASPRPAGTRRCAARLAPLALAIAAIAAVACQPGERRVEMQLYGEDVAFRVSSDPLPPRARERTVYRVVVRDSKTSEPIEGGEGRIFASSRDGASAWDSFVPGPELGTYYATLRYVTAGEWAVAIQFRRDSTRALQRVDWMQEVRAEREPGS